MPKLGLRRFNSQTIIRGCCCSQVAQLALQLCCLHQPVCPANPALSLFAISAASPHPCIASTWAVFLRQFKKKNPALLLYRNHSCSICSREDWKTTRGEEGEQLVWAQGHCTLGLAYLRLARKEHNLLISCLIHNCPQQFVIPQLLFHTLFPKPCPVLWHLPCGTQWARVAQENAACPLSSPEM